MDVAGVDFSTVNITSVDPGVAAQVVQSGIGHICLGFDSSDASTRVLATLLDAGLPLWSAYRFLYTWKPAAEQVQDCVNGIHNSNVMPVYFVGDVEDYPAGNWPTIAQIEAMMDAFDASDLRQLIQPAIYTREEFRYIYPGYIGPADRGWGLWLASWTTHGANIDALPLFNGWSREQIIGQQWSGDSASPLGVVDNDLFRLPDPTPVPDPQPPTPPDEPVDPASALARLKTAQAKQLDVDAEIQAAVEDLTPPGG